MRLLAVLLKGPGLVHGRIYSALWSRLLGAPGLRLEPGSLIGGDRHIRIGRRFRAGRLMWMEAVSRYGEQGLSPTLRIGDDVSCSDAVHVACAFDVRIGDRVLIGSKVHITDHNHGRYSGTGRHSPPTLPPAVRELTGAPVVIGDDVFLADGVVVLPGSEIGAGCVIGANAVVSGRIPPYTLCVGTPARPIKRFDVATGRWIALLPDHANASDDAI